MTSCDPDCSFAASLFIARKEKPENLEPVRADELSPFQRLLLITDGTVTRTLEAYAVEPIDVVCLDQEEDVLTEYHPWIEAETGTRVLVRRAILRGKHSETIYCYASSLIALERAPQIVREGLTSEGESEGLGDLLNRCQTETFREHLWCGIEHADHLPESLVHLVGTSFLSRTYRIFFEGSPLALIDEKFLSDTVQ